MLKDIKNLSDVELLNEIENVINADIRPILARDGGDMEIVDIQNDGTYLNVFIRYLGNCIGCALGQSSTLFGIEKVLKEKIANNVRVLPL